MKEKKFRCKICGLLVTFNTEAIRSHLQNFHNMSLNEYKPIYTTGTASGGGSAESVEVNGAGDADVQLRMPKLFQTLSQRPTSAQLQQSPQHQRMQLPATGAANNSLQESDPTTAEGGGGIGTAWYNRCKWTRMVCNKAFCSGFWRHVQEAHSLAKNSYLEQFGKAGIDIVFYFCRICNRKVPWSGASINGHTKAEHGMSLKEYEQVYGPPPSVCDAPLPAVQSQLSLFQLPSFPMPPHHPQILPALLSQPPTRNQTVEKWFNGCEYKCQLCARILYSVAGMSLHLRDAHFMDKFAYFRQFGRSGIKIKKYKCKICQKCFPWSGVSISKHVKQANSISLQKYSSLYENDSGPFERISEPDDEVDSSPSKMNNSLPAAPKQVKWFNKCSWTCQICGTTVTTNSSAFYKHVSEHQVPIDEYKEKYGNTGFVYVDHLCKLCKKRVPCNGLAMCKHFKHSHNMQLEEYESRFMKDDDGTSNSESYEPTDEFWYNKCIWKCQICGNKNRSMGSSKKHMQKAHNMTYDDYHAQFGTEGITEFDFKCRLCSVVMSCNGVTIASHLLNNHRLTLGEYEKKYLKKSSGGPGRADAGSPDIVERVPGRGLLQGDHFLASLKGDKQEGDEERQPTDKEANKAWYQKCQYICQLCKNTYYSISALRNHVKVKHNMERDEYIQRFGNNAGRIIEDYECKLCHRVLKCEGRSLNAHMRNCHKMGIIEYSRKYELERGGAGGGSSGSKGGSNGSRRKAGCKKAGRRKKQDGEDPHYANETYQIEVDNDDDDEEEEEKDSAAGSSSTAHMVSVDNDDDDEEDDDDDENTSFDPLSNVETVEEEDDDDEDDDNDDGDEIVDDGDDDELVLGEDVLDENLELEEEEEPLDLKPDIGEMAAAPTGFRILKEILENPVILPKVGGTSISRLFTSDEQEEEEDDNSDEDIADYTDACRVDPTIVATDDEDDDADADEDDVHDMEEVDDDEAGGGGGEDEEDRVNGDASDQLEEAESLFTAKVRKQEELLTL